VTRNPSRAQDGSALDGARWRLPEPTAAQRRSRIIPKSTARPGQPQGCGGRQQTPIRSGTRPAKGLSGNKSLIWRSR